MQSEEYILETYQRWQRKHFEYINTLSRTHAIGWSWLISGFQDTKVQAEDLLPVILDDKLKLPEKYSKPTLETIETLRRNIEAGKVPKKVLTALTADKILDLIIKE